MKEKYTVYICDYLEALPSNSQELHLKHYQLDDLITILQDNEKCLIIYPPNEVQEDEK